MKSQPSRGRELSSISAAFLPMCAGLVGGGNAWSRNLPGHPPFIIEETGLQWSVLGGIDIRLAHHLRLRAGELAYSKIYLSQQNSVSAQRECGLCLSHQLAFPSADKAPEPPGA